MSQRKKIDPNNPKEKKEVEGEDMEQMVASMKQLADHFKVPVYSVSTKQDTPVLIELDMTQVGLTKAQPFLRRLDNW